MPSDVNLLIIWAASSQSADFFFYPHRPAAPISVRGGMVNKEKASGRIMEWFFFFLNKTLLSSFGGLLFQWKGAFQFTSILGGLVEWNWRTPHADEPESEKILSIFPAIYRQRFLKIKFPFNAESTSAELFTTSGASAGLLNCKVVGGRRKQLPSRNFIIASKLSQSVYVGKLKKANRAEFNSGDFRAESRN